MKDKKEPTPHGGDYSEIMFLDKNGNKTTAEYAVEGAIYEYKADGTLLYDTHFICKPQKNDKRD